MLESLRIPSLVPGVVQMWHASARAACDSAAGPGLQRLLSAEERNRAERFHFEANRQEYIVGRGLLRLVLASQLQVAPHELMFEAGPFGKPELRWPQTARRVRFNVSHSADAVVAAFSVDAAVGVDVEAADRIVSQDVIAQAFTAEEIEQFSVLPPRERPAAIMRQWTLKEAYLKARGAGLNLPLLAFSFAKDRGGQPEVRFSPAIPDDPARWTFFQTELTGGHLAAVALHSPAGLSIEIHDLRRFMAAPTYDDCVSEHCLAVG